MPLDPRYNLLVDNAATAYGIPHELLRSQIEHESKGDPLAIGDGSLALGLLQVHPSAAATVGKSWQDLRRAIDAGAKDAAAAMGLEAGAAYLAWCFKHLGSWPWALAAYNQGPTVISRAKHYADAVLQTPSASSTLGAVVPPATPG